jgi:hypothetical protein
VAALDRIERGRGLDTEPSVVREDRLSGTADAAHEQSEPERHVLDRLRLDAEEIVIRLADPGQRREVVHHVAAVGARLPCTEPGLRTGFTERHLR